MAHATPGQAKALKHQLRMAERGIKGSGQAVWFTQKEEALRKMRELHILPELDKPLAPLKSIKGTGKRRPVTSQEALAQTMPLLSPKIFSPGLQKKMKGILTAGGIGAGLLAGRLLGKQTKQALTKQALIGGSGKMAIGTLVGAGTKFLGRLPLKSIGKGLGAGWMIEKGAEALGVRGGAGFIGPRPGETKRRRIDPTNSKALKRAVSRLSAYSKLNKRIEKTLRKLAPRSRTRVTTPGVITHKEAMRALKN